MCAPRRVIMAVLACFVGLLPAQAAFARVYKTHVGYLEDVTGERDERVEDVVVFEPPASDGPDLNQRIFNDQLSREFSDRYHEKFGYTEQQRAYLAPNQHTYYNDQFAFKGTAEQTDEEKRKFGEFMLRRLTEF